VTDAEIEKYGTGHQDPEPEPEPEPERERLDADLAEIRASAEAAEAGAAQLAEQETARIAEIDEAGINEPVAYEAQAEPSLEPTWQPGDVGGRSGADVSEASASLDAPQAEADVEAELEM
jgi:hypothetical protein